MRTRGGGGGKQLLLLQARAGQVRLNEGVSQWPFQSGALRALCGMKATAEEMAREGPISEAQGGTTWPF